MRIDFGLTAPDYGRYRVGFPESFFRRCAQLGVGRPGQRLLDLGTGTGTLARGFARLGCPSVGLDLAEPLLAQARRLDAETGVKVTYVKAPAEKTGLPSGSFDVVTAGQCWHWFDRPQVASEVRRLLAPAGRLLIAHYDWLPLPGTMVEATEALILQHNPAWRGAGGDGLHYAWFQDVTAAGFDQIESFTYDEPAVYSHKAWRGRIRASAGVAASLSSAAVAHFDRELAQLLATDYPEDPLRVPHRVFALLCQAP